jgi:hypothetical protein
MTGPRTGERVTLSVPQREQITARVAATGDGWLDVTLEDSPRTSLQRLERSKLFLQFVNADGICRLAGRLEAREGDAHLRMYGFGAGETLRFVTRGQIQLLRRPDGVLVPASARISLTAVHGDPVPVETRTREIGGRGITFRVPAGVAGPGALFQFDLYLDDGGPAVSGQVRVDEVRDDGTAEAHYTVLAGPDRSRLMRFAFDGSSRAA